MPYTYTKKNWLPRVRQYPDRFQLKDTATGAVVATYDLVRVEGSVSQPGTPMSPTNLNSHEDAIDFAVNAANDIREAQKIGTHVYGVSTTGNDTYVVTFTFPYTAYSAGTILNIKPNAGNTGVATINVDGLGAKSIKKVTSDGKVDVATGDIIANGVYSLIYDGTDFILINPNAINASLMTTQGDVIYASSANNPTRLAKGLYLQSLQMNSAETAPEWGNVMTGNKQIFTTSGTFTAPKTGIYKVICTGGGGSGGRMDGSCAGGGGAGGTSIKYITLSKGDSVTVTVGAKGTFPTSDNSAGATGGTSSFGSHCSATGGGGGAYMTSGFSSAGGANGTASNGDINLNGGAGDPGYYSGASPYGKNGTGGASYWGGGQHGGSDNPTVYGSGGSGNHTSASDGIVTVEW